MGHVSLQAAFDQTRQWLESNDLDRAIGMAQHILETYPKCLEAHQMLGEAFLSNRQYEEARIEFEKVLSFDPEHIPALVGLGMTSERLGQLPGAIAAFERALEIKPDLPELRSQLLRLYTEAWGSEYAHLRLSRVGLARLYAKGHMLPQAISEFRQVVMDQPDRLDARVALAEVLWRDEQEEEAVDVCRAILVSHPDVLKANLILGYIELASGNPSGEQYWRKALTIDPYQSMARMLFESLPPVDAPDPVIPEWDETEWLKRRVTASVEQLTATRSMEATTPTAVAVPPPPPLQAPPSAYDDSNDFLAALLAIDTAPPVTSSPVEEAAVEIDADTRPFTLDEFELSEAELERLGAWDEAREQETEAPSSQEASPPAETAPAEEAPSEIGTMQPFSLEELGLSPEEIAGLDSVATPAPAETTPAGEAPPEIGALQPFSLEELGLSPEEIASLSSEPIPPRADISQPDDVEIDMRPFSLDDIEEGGYPSAVKPGVGLDIGDVPPDLQPFSIEELETEGLSGQTDIGELPPSLQPFSLDEPPTPQRPRMAGLSPEEASESPIEEEDSFMPRGFSWQQPTQRTEPAFLHTASSTAPAETGTIFEKLQKQRESVRLSGAEEPPAPSIAPDEHLGLFSLDNVSLRDDDRLEEGGFSSIAADQWLPSVSTPESPMREEPVSAGDAGKSHVVNIEEVESIEAGLASGVIQPFSFADLGLTDEEIAALGLSVAPEQPAVQVPESPAEASAGLTPQIDEEEPAVASPHSEEPVVTHETKHTDIEAETLAEALARGEVQPFTLTDLGLSEEEIAALGLSTPEAVAPSAAPAEPVTPAPPAREAETLAEALARGEVQPFTLTDLGLSEEEIAALGLDEARVSAPPVEPAAPVQATTGTDEAEMFQPAEPVESSALVPSELAEEETGIENLQPFSLADLGLSEEELGEFDLSDLTEGGLEYDEGRLGITEEELSALGTGGDLEWLPESASVQELPVESVKPTDVSPGFESIDETVDRLIRLGHERGYVDIADIIATVKDPEMEADRIDEIGRKLHAARIQIRDGDEIIDLDAEYAEGEELLSPEGTSQPAPNDMSAEEEDLMRPFSLEELGLSDDEIALLAAATAGQQENVPPPAEEPPLTPFSLEELGLSDDEIAMISAAASAVETSPAEESPLTPFSLEDLDLSGAEVVQTDKATSPSGVTPPPSTVSETETLIDLEPVVQPEEAVVRPQPLAQERKETPVSVVPPIVTEKQPPPATSTPIVTATSPPSLPSAVPKDLSAFPELQEYVRMLDSDPGNHVLRLSIARVGGQVGMMELAMQHYRSLIKQNALLDEIVDDLSDMIAETSDVGLLRKLHRALGDAYSRQGRFRDAMREYSWIPGQG